MQKRYHCSGYLITSAALNHAVGISNNQKHGILSISRDDRWLCFEHDRERDREDTHEVTTPQILSIPFVHSSPKQTPVASEAVVRAKLQDTSRHE